MSEALDKEWLAGCEPHVLDKIETWFKEPRATTAIDIMASAKAEIRALQTELKFYKRRVDELSKELEALTEPQEND